VGFLVGFIYFFQVGFFEKTWGFFGQFFLQQPCVVQATNFLPVMHGALIAKSGHILF